jgi:hypothetical protein
MVAVPLSNLIADLGLGDGPVEMMPTCPELRPRHCDSALERVFYGLSECEITDLDGNVLCLSQALQNDGDLPAPSA